MRHLKLYQKPYLLIGVALLCAHPGWGNGTKTLDSGVTDTIIIGENNTLWAWGLEVEQEDGSFLNPLAPVLVSETLDWKYVSSGATHTAMVKTDGTLWTFGFNGRG